MMIRCTSQTGPYYCARCILPARTISTTDGPGKCSACASQASVGRKLCSTDNPSTVGWVSVILVMASSPKPSAVDK